MKLFCISFVYAKLHCNDNYLSINIGEVLQRKLLFRGMLSLRYSAEGVLQMG